VSARQLVNSVAALDCQLIDTSKPISRRALCAALARSMISDNRSISIKFSGKGGASISRNAESIGFIVTELVINSLKHAFNETTKDGEINVAYDVSGTDWQLAVADNGSGKPDGVFAQPKTGLSAFRLI